jgi:hypothetical protein
LAILVTGLFLAGLVPATWSNPMQEVTDEIPAARICLAGAATICVAIGASWVFLQRKIVLDRCSCTVTCVFSALRRKCWRIDDVGQIEYVAVVPDLHECYLVFKSGDRLLLCRGFPDFCRHIGAQIATFLGLPRTSREAAK